MKLRDYQQDAVDATFDYFERRSGDPLIVAPTGAGKSVMIAGVIEEALRKYPTSRIMVLTHVQELVEQNAQKMKALCPQLAPRIGIYSAGLGYRDTVQPVIFAGIHSVYRRLNNFGKRDLFIIDEAHLVPTHDSGMYRRAIRDSRTKNEDLRVLGVTATPFRTDSGLITSGSDKLFSSVCYNIDIVKLIDEGYLSPLTTEDGCVSYDTAKVEVRGGEFVASQLNKLISTSYEITLSALKDVQVRGKNRRSWVVFCAGVDQANQAMRILQDDGIPTQIITGDTDKGTRAAAIQAYKAGTLRCLVNVNVLTTGFDAPETDLLALLRPTKSPVLYTQMLGRGMRIAEGKKDCLVLDYGNNLTRHGPINKIRPKAKGGGDGDAPMKSCPHCYAEVAAGFRRCPECDFEFPEPEVAITKKHERGEYVARKEKWYDVTRVAYKKHIKPGKPPSLKVEYFSGLLVAASEWVCVEHFGMAKEKAIEWFRKRYDAFPTTVDDALEIAGDLREPKRILVDNSGKYTRVKSYEFEGDISDDQG